MTPEQEFEEAVLDLKPLNPTWEARQVVADYQYMLETTNLADSALLALLKIATERRIEAERLRSSKSLLQLQINAMKEPKVLPIP